MEGQTRDVPRRQERECPADLPADGILKKTLGKERERPKEKEASR
ncbi:hypothetical protein DESPIG_01787 [Desulfovibrio piger ATCC 29098]|uniref:Uncharacterized protein n=1 Tax=Desulfovibrio piger ATCC 29098 TaxID=411464 RepID=B6WUM6_9BACT|nr:hypothetical protein DESPIG_01787 [Desulfovibrio piger ATCC 29098]